MNSLKRKMNTEHVDKENEENGGMFVHPKKKVRRMKAATKPETAKKGKLINGKKDQSLAPIHRNEEKNFEKNNGRGQLVSEEDESALRTPSTRRISSSHRTLSTQIRTPKPGASGGMIKEKNENQEPWQPEYSPFTTKQVKLEKSIIVPEFQLQPFQNVVSIEGNIGCGKSTLLKRLEAEGYFVLQEPVPQCWDKYLPLLYENTRRWGCTFQCEVLLWFHRVKNEIIPKYVEKGQINKYKKSIIVERSPQSSFQIFCTNMKDAGLLTDWEFSVYMRIYNAIGWEPPRTIYLQVQPEICITRIKKRNRKSESKLNKDGQTLIHALHKKHEDVWGTGNRPNVHVIDASKSVEEVTESAISFLKKSD